MWAGSVADQENRGFPTGRGRRRGQPQRAFSNEDRHLRVLEHARVHEFGGEHLRDRLRSQSFERQATDVGVIDGSGRRDPIET